MANFRTLVGLGLTSTMMITAPVFASTSTAAKPATHQAAPSKHAASAWQARPAKAAMSNGKKTAY
ncbi:hypothetical protein WBQ88_12130 [Sphingopyxis sp. CCNWLW253]|uniref:hypothetical protein n=1 Tax=unclassified Sphingopyxis TaxID=2614943 RepID=UPI003012D950